MDIDDCMNIVVQDHTKEELDAWKLVRVHEDFRVIALGLPVPRYQGNPLDPPLRSRFQARDINPVPFKVCSLQVFNNITKGLDTFLISSTALPF